MSGSAVLGATALVWLMIALGLGLGMHRQGYNGLGWGILGAVFGPLAVVVALFTFGRAVPDRNLRRGAPGGGDVDVLVGIDGSSESREAARAAIDLFGDRLGRLTLATVESLDPTPEEQRHAGEALHAALDALEVDRRPGSPRPAAVVLHGRPADALRDFAAAEGFDVLSIGPRGHGATKAILGSTAGALMRRSPIPVLVGPSEASVPVAAG